MELVSEWAKRIPIKVRGKEEVLISTPESFLGLTESLRENKIYKGTTLEYLNDFGNKVQINDERSFCEFLACSNGFFHYLDCTPGAIASTGSKELVFFDEKSPWKCIICCFDSNKPEFRNCSLCKSPRT